MKRRMYSYDFWETWVQIILLVVGCPIIMLLAHRGGMPDRTLVITATYGILGFSLLLAKKILQDRLLDYKGALKQFANDVRTVKKWHMRSAVLSILVFVPYVILFIVDYLKIFATYQGTSTESLLKLIITVVFTIAVAIYVETRKLRLLDNIINEIEE